jgi:hypothetical protein
MPRRKSMGENLGKVRTVKPHPYVGNLEAKYMCTAKCMLRKV